MSEAVTVTNKPVYTPKGLYEYHYGRVKDAESKKQSLEKELKTIGEVLKEERLDRDKYKRQYALEEKKQSKDIPEPKYTVQKFVVKIEKAPASS